MALLWEETEAVGDQSKRAKNTRPLLMRPRVDEMSMLGPFQPSINLLRVGHPLDQLLWSWAVGHQEGKNLLRGLDEKLTLLVLWRLEQRNRECFCFAATAQFLCWSPIGATLIERIQDHIAIPR